MFTGLVEAVGQLVERTPTAGGFRVQIATSLSSELSEGDSLAVNGVCLTVVAAGHGAVFADIGPETNRVTTLGSLSEGAVVNLERPLRADGRLGGHFVQGHVDAVGRLEAIRPDADFQWITVSFPSHLAPYFIHKGSVAVDGISLTVASLGDAAFDVQIVPFTMQHTNLSRAQVRDRVNLECDMLAKYVIRAAQFSGLTMSTSPPGEVTH